MADMGNFGNMEDYLNARAAWLGSRGKSDRIVVVYLFQEYQVNDSAVPDERSRLALYAKKTTHVWLSYFKSQDTTVAGRFKAGDLDVSTDFELRGYQAPVTLTSGVAVPGRASDLLGYNGKIWEVSDVLEPIQWGYQQPQVWYNTVMRHSSLASENILLKQT